MSHQNLEAVLRTMARAAQIAAGDCRDDYNHRSWSAEPHISACKRKRDEGISSVVASLSNIVENKSNPQPIIIRNAALIN